MPAYRTETHAPETPAALTAPDADIPSVHEAKRASKLAKAALKRSKAEAKVAAKRAALAKAESKLELRSERMNREEERFELAKRGYRTTLFGRVVPVRGSYRARPHARRL